MSNDVKCERIFLYEQKIAFCRGCRLCFDKGEQECPMKDDLLPILEKIQKSDALIIGSPVYVEDVSGSIKNWIDRMAFNSHRPVFSGKPALIFTTSGVGSSSHAIRTMKTALNTWGFNVVGQLKFEGKNKKKNAEVGIEKACQKFHRAICNQDNFKPAFNSLLFFKVQQSYWQKQKEETFDVLFWQKKVGQMRIAIIILKLIIVG